MLASLVLTLATVSPTAASAQAGDGWEILKLEITRSRLEQLLHAVDQQLSTQKLSDADRIPLSYRATVIRKRLTEGDFRPGDHIVLAVEGIPSLTDTFTVGPGPSLTLPMVGDVDLKGLLRSELEPFLTRRIAQVVREPKVRAEALIQLSILGEVTRPGFYLVTPDALLTEALMAAGGPTQSADFSKLKIERGPGSVWSPGDAPKGPIESYTVNELGLRTGDRIVIPAKNGLGRRDLIQVGLLGLTTLFTILSVAKVF